jgi:hypothetical protein
VVLEVPRPPLNPPFLAVGAAHFMFHLTKRVH